MFMGVCVYLCDYWCVCVHSCVIVWLWVLVCCCEVVGVIVDVVGAMHLSNCVVVGVGVGASVVMCVDVTNFICWCVWLYLLVLIVGVELSN